MNLVSKQTEIGEIWYREGLDDSTVDEVFVNRFQDPPSWPFQPTTILDCGANIGLTMAWYRALFPEAYILGVEMDPENVAIARQNTNDPILCAAVGPERVMNYDGGVAPHSYALSSAGNRVTIGVSLRKLRACCPELSVIDFLKLDIEGAEEALLRRGLWKVRSVLIETHHGYSRETANKRLQRLGYRTNADLAHPRAVFAWKDG